MMALVLVTKVILVNSSLTEFISTVPFLISAFLNSLSKTSNGDPLNSFAVTRCLKTDFTTQKFVEGGNFFGEKNIS